MPPEYYEALKNILHDAQNRLQRLQQAGYYPLVEEPQPAQQPKQPDPPALPTRPTPPSCPGKPRTESSSTKKGQTNVVKSAGKQIKLVYEYVTFLLWD